MSFSATDCPLDDICMDIHMSEKTPTSLGHQLRGMEREANAKVVSLAVVAAMEKLVEVVVMEIAKVVVMVVVVEKANIVVVVVEIVKVEVWERRELLVPLVVTVAVVEVVADTHAEMRMVEQRASR